MLFFVKNVTVLFLKRTLQNKALFKMNLKYYYQQSQYYRAQLMPALVAQFSPLYAKLFKRNEKIWAENRQSLLAREKDSLGFALGLFLQTNDLHLMPRLETHDVYHVITAYPIDVQSEAELLFFILGNGKRTLFTLGATCLALILMPEWWGIYWQSFLKGRKANSFVNENLVEWLDKPLAEIRAYIFENNTMT